MIVKRVETRIVTRQYQGSLRMHHQEWIAKHAVIVFLEASDGTIGLGEAWCDAGDPRIVKAFIDRDLAPAAIGEDIRCPEAIWRKLMKSKVMGQRGGALYAAAGAIDTAIWDLFARSCAVPLYKLLGGASDRIPVYASGGFYGVDYGPEDLARDMADGIRQGCIGVKIKAGLAHPDEEEARIAAVRSAIGEQRWLMADFLFAPTVQQAIACARRFANYGLRFLEAPTALENFPGWRRIKAATGLALAGPEIACGLDRFRSAIHEGEVDYLQLDVTLCGGVTEARRIAGLAAAHDLPLSLHCSGSAVALAANAQLGAAWSGADSIEYHLLHQTLFEHLWSSNYRIAEGLLLLPQSPGLGIEIAPDDPMLAAEGGSRASNPEMM